jgi:EAL domain-containing protein (putative c-di-GMP-specific phosphodiesterase class I)
LASDQLVVVVQPKAMTVTGVVHGVEALVRWQHPTLGLVEPDHFVPLAERSGLIRPLTSFVLRTALAACASWRRQRVDIGVSVNLSARGLTQGDLVEEVARLLEAARVPPYLLTLEITENSIMNDPTRAVEVLQRLHRLGVRLSLDDFGTGYSSLSYLKALPVHEVKIDRSFVATMLEREDDAQIVRSIIDLGGNLALDVVAEGVEDAATWRKLADLGCDFVQGYHLSRPLPIDELLDWWRDYESRRAAAGTLRVG